MTNLLHEQGRGRRAVVITVSDRCWRGEQRDESGDLLVARLEQIPARVLRRITVPDEQDQICEATRAAIVVADLVALTGGTGLAPRDVTPQAIGSLLDYEVPGMAEAMRRRGTEVTPLAVLSRQVTGVAGRCLVVALPGRPSAVSDSLDAVWPALLHALHLLAGDTEHTHLDAGR